MAANLGHKVIFYPKFHCELNLIEPYWCKAKWYTRKHCDYSLEGLCQTVPEALASVEQKTSQNGKACMLSYAKINHIESLVLINTYKGGATLLKGPLNMPSL